MLMTKTERDRRWLITGVSSGLGLALAEAVLARGDRVIGTVRNERAQKEFGLLSPGKSYAVKLDLADTRAIPQLVADIEHNHGPIDILVNNAGYGYIGAVEETSIEDMRAQFEVNVFGTVAMIQAVLPSMRARRNGHIINISSVSGRVAWSGLGIYSGCKFALTGISETLAQEVTPLGIKVTIVEPGGLRTDWSGRSMARASHEIADYTETSGKSRCILEEHRGHQPGDPHKAADAIIRIADLDAPPLHLLLGTDALKYARQKLDELLANMIEWEAVSAGISDGD